MASADNPLEVFFDLVPTGAALYAPVYDAHGELVDFRFARLNPAGQRLLGLPAQPPHTFREYYPNSVPTGIFAQYRTAYLTGQATAYDVPYTGDGLDTYFRLVAQRSGELLVVNFTDMADLPHSAVEQALRDDRAREQAARAADAERQRQLLEQERATFYQVFELTPAAICIQRGPAHRYKYANQAYRDFFPGRPLIGQPVAEALPETVASGVVDLLDHVYQTGETYHGYELPLLIAQPGGPPRQRYFNFTYQALREHGEIVGISTFAYDVAEQVLTRQEREQQRQQLYDLFMQAPAAICILAGPDLVYELVNSSYQQMFPNRPLLGKPLLEALPELRASPTWDVLQRVYRTGRPHVDLSVHIPFARQREGALEDRHFNYVFQARTDPQGQGTGVLVFAFEVTEQLRARHQVERLNQELTATNAEVHESNARLRRTNTDLDTFVYAASHDLKAPIANIEGLLEALREYLPPADQEPMVPRLVGMMEGAITLVLQTVGHLTDVSRLQDEGTAPPEAVDLTAVLEDVRLDLLPLLESTQTELVLDLAACLPVFFSAKNLRSVLFNLLSNAVKYRAPDRRPLVHLRTQCTATHLVLDVQDNGLGLDTRQQTQLFTMFRRLHTHVEGSGVGLYLIKRTLENAGGTIAVRSQPGVGSTFTVTIPRA